MPVHIGTITAQRQRAAVTGPGAGPTMLAAGAGLGTEPTRPAATRNEDGVLAGGLAAEPATTPIDTETRLSDAVLLAGDDPGEGTSGNMDMGKEAYEDILNGR